MHANMHTRMHTRTPAHTHAHTHTHTHTHTHVYTFPLTQCCLGSSGSHSGVHHRSKKGHSGHDRIACLTERNGLMGQGSQRHLLTIGVLDRQSKKV